MLIQLHIHIIMEAETLRKLCLQWPAVTEDIKWGNDLCFLVAEKMFCISSLDPPFKISFKVPDDDFEELSVSGGFIPAPYMARAKWVQVNDLSRLSKGQWEQYIRQSYELVKARLSKKIKNIYGLD